MENEPHIPKISTVEAFLIIGFVGLLDVIDLFLLAFLMDDFFIIDILAFPVTQLYFRMKGVRANYALWGNITEMIPYLDKLPARTAGVIWTIWADRHPETASLIPVIGKQGNVKAQKQEGAKIIRPRFGDEEEEREAA